MSNPTVRSRLIRLPENRSAWTIIHEIFTALARGNFASAVPVVLLHGPGGVGKTFLLGEAIHEADNLDIQAWSARDLAYDPSEVSLEQSLFDADLTALEDLQFLPASAWERVVQLLDHRHSLGRPTLVTANAGPRHLNFRGERFPSRLASRLAAGLVVSMPAWSAASRRTFLEERALQKQLAVPAEVFDWLAERLVGNGRILEGAMHQLHNLYKLQPHRFTLKTIVDHFQSQIDALKPSIERIATHVGKHFQLKPKQLQSRSRLRGFLVPRQVSMYLARRLTPLSLQQIGDYFGGHDHTTVLHACKKIDEALTADAGLAGTVYQLQTELG